MARAPFPSLAWQVAGEQAQAAGLRDASVVTTLDASLQTRLEPLAAKLADAEGQGASAAVLVIEVEDPRGAGGGRLGRAGPHRRLARHDAGPALAGLGPEAVHLRHGLRGGTGRAGHRACATRRSATPATSPRTSTAPSTTR